VVIPEALWSTHADRIMSSEANPIGILVVDHHHVVKLDERGGAFVHLVDGRTARCPAPPAAARIYLSGRHKVACIEQRLPRRQGGERNGCGLYVTEGLRLPADCR
jgi:hypothetical protein